jgi:hypothetical protein
MDDCSYFWLGHTSSAGLSLSSIMWAKYKTKRGGIIIPARFAFIYPAIMSVGKPLMLRYPVISRQYKSQATLKDYPNSD